MNFKNIITSIFLSITLLLPLISVAAPTISDQYQLEDRKRISRTEYEYTYKVTLTNTESTAIKNVKASATSTSPQTVLVDNTVSFNDLAVGESGKSTDVLVIRQNRRSTFDPNKIQWNIQFDGKKEISDAVSKAFNLDPTKEDTDGDGLTDVFEITYGYPTLKPDVSDSDGNGVSDGDEDTDGDTITNLKEQANNTNPLAMDTDNDQLNDADEIIHKTNALKEDTDGDGMLDGREVANGTNPLVADSNTVITSTSKKFIKNINTGQLEEIIIKVTGEGDLSNKIIIFNESDAPIQGQVGRRFDISLPPEDIGKMQSVDITLPFDASSPNASDPTKLAIYTINPNTGFWEKLNSIVDIHTSTVTATTNHFSPFVISNTTLFNEYISKIPETCRPIDDPNKLPADVMLVIDSSGSMRTNDPNNLRIAASKSFTAAMKSSDRVGVVDFNGSSKLLTGLTNQIGTINNVLDTIDSSGSTAIGAGVQTAITELSNNSDSSKVRAIILLTDGSGSYNSSLTTRMVNEGIRAFTIGLTGSVNESLLKDIAEKTRGGYKKIDSADDLVGVFNDFSTVFGDDGKDDDNDGLTNCQEIQGIYLLNNSSITQTDPSNPDSDGDGILDGSEVGIPKKATSAGFTIWFSDAYSDPNSEDWDGDGLSDSEEYQASTNAFAKDTDSDGLNDGDETLVYYTDPGNPDTDGDTLNDGDEVTRKNEGFDPTVYNYKVNFLTRAIYIGQITKGCLAGDFANIDELPELMGYIPCSFIPLVDLRDLIANSFKGEWFNAGASFVGLIPVGGDLVKGGKAVNDFVTKKPSLRYEVIKYVSKYFPEGLIKYLPKIPEPGAVWKLNPFQRGKELEIKIAANLPGKALLSNFPKVDIWDAVTGKVTSIKTLDLNAKSYQRISAFKRIIKRYADDLNDFEGTSTAGWAGTVISENAIRSRDLVVGIPKELINDFSEIAKDVAKEKGVNIIFKVIE